MDRELKKNERLQSFLPTSQQPVTSYKADRGCGAVPGNPALYSALSHSATTEPAQGEAQSTGNSHTSQVQDLVTMESEATYVGAFQVENKNPRQCLTQRRGSRRRATEARPSWLLLPDET